LRYPNLSYPKSGYPKLSFPNRFIPIMSGGPHVSFSMILAETTDQHGIGLNGGMPWKLKFDMEHFSRTTRSLKLPNTQNVCICGRNTWDSIPEKQKPLKGCQMIVLSKTPEKARIQSQIPPEVPVVKSLRHALHWCSSPDIYDSVGKIWIIGGAALYNEGMTMSACQDIYVTHIDWPFECDVFWKGIDYTNFSEIKEETKQLEEKGVPYRFAHYRRNPPHGEYAYLDLVRRILSNGSPQIDRTKVGTISLFGAQMRFDLRCGFPLLTTKRIFWKAVKTELLWFISGCTDAKKLSQSGVHIWDENGSRAFLDKRGLTEYPEGQLGPVYGFQWRHYGAEYTRSDTDYKGQGVDQLAECIRLIKTEPNSRRIIMSAWNPLDIPKMALPPCHILCQFYVAGDVLSCQLYQRSADMGLGVPFNIASYALLTHLVAHVCNLKVGDFVHSIGDCHVYTTHKTALIEQISRTPFPFPKLVLNPLVKNVDDFKLEDITLENYQCHDAIKMEMAL
jgi:dihydrofolate reductase/thymidylate synthase